MKKLIPLIVICVVGYFIYNMFRDSTDSQTTSSSKDADPAENVVQSDVEAEELAEELAEDLFLSGQADTPLTVAADDQASSPTDPVTPFEAITPTYQTRQNWQPETNNQANSPRRGSNDPGAFRTDNNQPPRQRSRETLQKLHVSEWGVDEAESNQRLFLNRYKEDVDSALKTIQEQIVYYSRKKQESENASAIAKEAIQGLNRHLDEGRAAILKARQENKDISEDLSNNMKDWLESRDRKETQAMQSDNTIQICKTQLDLLKDLRDKKEAELLSIEYYLKRLESEEKITEIRSIYENFKIGQAISRQLDEQRNNLFIEEDNRSEAIKMQKDERLEKFLRGEIK